MSALSRFSPPHSASLSLRVTAHTAGNIGSPIVMSGNSGRKRWDTATTADETITAATAEDADSGLNKFPIRTDTQTAAAETGSDASKGASACAAVASSVMGTNKAHSESVTPRTGLSNAYRDFKTAANPEESISARQRVVEARAKLATAEANKQATVCRAAAEVRPHTSCCLVPLCFLLLSGAVCCLLLSGAGCCLGSLGSHL